ncbi:Atx10homo assoc domain containing protein [Trichuris trichiura]|uniref:Ataxin-10 n=1 Tax=Trichuris trichiura TaxID=36087 RepID=A0A077ZP89_TRITR|nr:Atx10homo assoc domain containing protein [Trichuris trichiura]
MLADLINALDAALEHCTNDCLNEVIQKMVEVGKLIGSESPLPKELLLGQQESLVCMLDKMNRLLEMEAECKAPCALCAIEFIARIAKFVPESVELLREHMETSFATLLAWNDSRVSEHACWLLLTIIDHNLLKRWSENLPEKNDLWNNFLTLLQSGNSQAELLLQKMFTFPGSVAVLFSAIDDFDIQSTLASHLCNAVRLKQLHNSNLCPLVSYLSKMVSRLNDNCEDESFLRTLRRLVKAFCIATSDDKSPYFSIRSNASLLTAVVDILRQIDEFAKNGIDIYKRKRDFDGKPNGQNENPASGLKQCCIRLIANLTCDHHGNCVLARKLGVLPIVLESTRFDCCNLFMTQWAVFALRNMMKEDTGCREYVSSMKPSAPMKLD